MQRRCLTGSIGSNWKLKFGLDGPMLHAIMSLHSAPSEKVWSLGLLSIPFPITNGTHQGSLLSLLIFALVIKSLAQAIHLTPHITGLTVGQASHKIGLYAYDIIIWLTDPLKSLTTPCELLDRFPSPLYV